MGYKEFYENVDRVNTYSAGLNPESHTMYSKLSDFISDNHFKDKRVLEIGSGNGRFQDIVDDYSGIDISEQASKFFHKPYFIVKDGNKYPFADESFDFVFTNAVFEHIPDINHALQEMMRVTKKGGCIMFNPAWQCRPWAANGYQVRPYSDFNILGKLYKALIPLRENLLFRLAHVLPLRLIHIILFALGRNRYKEKLKYRKLKANYETFWQSDSDACNSIDPFMAILYFKANGLKIVNYPNSFKQLLIRTNEIILLKP
jgi:ubiquinone/menaquinone biosynthesis C-methylase UbiE